MKQKTAVEWLLDELILCNELILKGENYKLMEQAKSIEKEQILNAWCDGLDKVNPLQKITAEKYYNKTYNK